MKKIAILAASIFVVFSGYFVSPAPLAFAQGAPTDQGSLVLDTNIESAVEKGCSNWSNPFSANCLLYAFYNVILEPSFWLVGVAAKILDFFLGYSLDSNAYRSDFIIKGWGLIRDISNVAFIFTLLYLAIRHILGSSSKKYIPTLIIVALLLNFSLFFTKVVIDAGNILARAFYNSIVIENDQSYADAEGYKSITFGIVDKINPQNLLSSSIFLSGSSSASGQYSTQTGQFTGTVTPVIEKTGTIFAVFILMVIVNGFLMWTFVSVALLFVGRVIGLWFSMIFSPIAFITLAVPGSGGLVKQMSFDTWKDTVLKLAFMAPIFIFFLYLMISFLSIFGTGPAVPAEGADIFTNLMKIFIPFIFIIVLLQIAKKTADSMAGEFGSMVKSIVGKVAGVAAGGALGATAFAGRKVVGGLASSALKAGNYNARIAEARTALKNTDDPVQKRLLQKELYSLQSTKNRLNNWKKSSFDIRNADKSKMLGGAVGGVAGFAGKNIIKPASTAFAGDKMTFGKGSTESRDKFEKDKRKEKLEMAEDQSSVSFRERDKVVGKRRQDELFALLDTKNEIKRGFDEETKEVTERLDELIKKGVLNKDESEERDKLEKRLNKEIPEEREKKLKEIDKKGEEVRRKKDEDFIKDEEKERRGLVADAVASRDVWGMMMGVDNKEIANDIRSGKASKSDAEKFSELAKKLAKEDEKPKPATPPSATPPPGGGAI